MTSTTSRRLTETLKKARKQRYFTDTGDLTPFSYAWKWPQHIDWVMTGPVATSLYDEASQLVDDLEDEGKTLTACQQRLLRD